MKERPILFSAPMILALLANTKTQTRRALSPQPPETTHQVTTWHHPDPRPHFFAWTDNGEGGAELADGGWRKPCPYGAPGDHLWVREAWAPGDDMVFGAAKDDPETVLYRADKAALHWNGKAMCAPLDTYAFHWESVRWKPSLYMPRWASRITLEVTEIRVERLQDISEADALAEGVAPAAAVEFDLPHQLVTPAGRRAYARLWEQINGPGSWDANPWVWVVAFNRATP